MKLTSVTTAVIHFLITVICNTIMENKLKYVNGTKVRWQFFTVPFIMHLALMATIPIIFLIVSIQQGTFTFLKWTQEVINIVSVTLFLCTPWLILMFLNRFCFGKIICIITDKGIHTNEGFISFNDILKVEYEISNQKRYVFSSDRCNRALIYTNNGVITLIHAPLYMLSSIKKHKENIKTGFSKESKIRILLIVLVFIIFVIFTSLLNHS